MKNTINPMNLEIMSKELLYFEVNVEMSEKNILSIFLNMEEEGNICRDIF